MPRSEWSAVVHDGKNRRSRYRTWLECLTKVYRDFNQQKVVATADGSADNILKCTSSLALMRCVTDDISCGLTSFSLSW